MQRTRQGETLVSNLVHVPRAAMVVVLVVKPHVGDADPIQHATQRHVGSQADHQVPVIGIRQ